MAVSPSKTWVALEVLTASDLNNEFLNVYNNGQTIGSPRTASFDMDGQKLILDADADTSITADTDDQIDIEVAGSDVVLITSTYMAINGKRVQTARTAGASARSITTEFNTIHRSVLANAVYS